jgi:uncharacterized membrane protein/sporulation protein YlmC with PRC-barrel domain
MREIALNADVSCTDGYAGKVTHIVVDPQQKAVTGIVVKNKEFVAQDRVVPTTHIVESSRDRIRLNCTVADVAAMQPFSTTHYVDYAYNDYTPYDVTMGVPYSIPTATTSYTEIVDEALPQGQRALVHGAQVQASDGMIGTVGALVIDSESGKITHFTLQTGHIWGKKEVMLPLSAVRSAEEGVVHLKLDKHAVKSLAAVPRKSKKNEKGRPESIELIARIFDAPHKAEESLLFVQELERQQHGALKILNAAILVKDAEGKTKITEMGELSPKKGSLIGAVAGGLLGALAGPVGIAVGAAAGAGLGRASTRWIDLGLPNEFLQRMQSTLKPDSSALILLVEHRYLKQLSQSMAEMEGIVLQHTFNDSAVAQLLQEQEG